MIKNGFGVAGSGGSGGADDVPAPIRKRQRGGASARAVPPDSPSGAGGSGGGAEAGGSGGGAEADGSGGGAEAGGDADNPMFIDDLYCPNDQSAHLLADIFEHLRLRLSVLEDHVVFNKERGVALMQ